MENWHENKLYLNRFSILLAFLALGFCLLYLVPIESTTNQINLFGITFNISFFSFIPLILALLAAVGAIWVFVTHPSLEDKDKSFLELLPHLMLPFIATLILAIVLRQSARSQIWWVVLLAGYLILVILLRAEFVLIEEEGVNQLFYALVVISFSYGMFLIFMIALKNSNVRMFMQLILVFISSFFVTYRTFTIRQRTDLKISHTLLIAWLITQLAVGLHYLFINPIQYGLLLTGSLYAVTTWIHLFEPNKKWHHYKEPFVMLVVTLLILVFSSVF